ncbi:MAG: alpha/beta hydrolase [Actinomycetia bacterium]|nr:alpha/beta hydrolase [Actinomycetes bacterium]
MVQGWSGKYRCPVRLSVAPIVANSVLPAHRTPLGIETRDQIVLRGELATPTWCDPVATLVCVHPLTIEGGSMESHVLRKLAWRLPALAGLAVLRFNMRGAGTGAMRSEGEFDSAQGEGLDLGAVLARVTQLGLPEPWLVGWSFGTDVVLKFGARSPVAGAVLLSPPLRFAEAADLSRWAATDLPLVAVVPEHDDYLKPEPARAAFATIPQAKVVAVQGAGHLWVGERYVQEVLNQIVRVVAPVAYPLPREWNGPMTRWSDL